MNVGFRRLLDNVLGQGDAAVTVPPMDGALRPNRRLDEVGERLACPRPSGLVATALGVFVSSGTDLLHLGTDRTWKLAYRLPAMISAVAPLSNDGIVAGLEDGQIRILGGRFENTIVSLPDGARCPTSFCVVGNLLYVCQGSATNAPSQWRRDLMERNSTGSIWRVDLPTGRFDRIATGLAFPSGIVVDASDLVVSESWKHRLVRIKSDKPSEIDEILGDLPGYPGHLVPATAGGYWLSVFAPRSQLVEFVLREASFRKRMMVEVEPNYWISPTLRAGKAFYEPLQGGGVKHLGILKPWAPTRSFGLLVRLDDRYQPVDSLQSRADGQSHGVTSVAEHGGILYVAAQGDEVIISLTAADLGSKAGQ